MARLQFVGIKKFRRCGRKCKKREKDFPGRRISWWFMRSARSRGRGQKRRLNYVPDANVGRIVRCRRRAPSIFQLPWKFRSWETRFASVHTLNNVAVQSATAPSLLSFLSLPKKRVGGEGKERKERNKNKKMVSVIVARDSIPVDFFRPFYLHARHSLVEQKFPISIEARNRFSIVSSDYKLRISCLSNPRIGN